MCIGVGLCCTACSGSAPIVHDVHAAGRVPALGEAVRTEDEAALRRAVEQLDADDPLIRMMAITSLQRRTGRDLGYDFADGPSGRRDGVQRWVDEVGPHPRMDPDE